MTYLIFSILLAVSIYLFFYTLFFNYKKQIKKTGNKLGNIINSIKDINKIEKGLEEKIFKAENENKRKARIDSITGAKKSLAQKVKGNINNLILNKSHSWGYLLYTIFTCACAAVGYIIGISLNNIGVAFLLAIVGTALPYLYLTYITDKKNEVKDKDLLIVMGNITSSYMNSNSFVTAIDEVLSTIPRSLYRYFKLFVDEIKYFGEDSFEHAAIRLANQVNNYFFYEYMQLAIQSEKGESGLKYTMKSVPVDYQSYLERNERFNREVESYNIEFSLMLFLFPLAIKFLQLISKEYYYILVNNFIGKLLLFIIVIVYIVSTFLFRKYNKEIKLEL